MRHTRNQGQITIYGCGIVAVSLILVIAVLQGIRIYEAKGRAYQAMDGAVKSLKGDYQPDLFQRYHIFAIDETYYGRGEGYMEERTTSYLNNNLNSSRSLYVYEIADCAIVDQRYLLDHDCEDFKAQITDYMQEKMVIDAARVLFGSFGCQEESEGSETSIQPSVMQHLWNEGKESDGGEGDGIDLKRSVTDQEIQDLGMTGIYQEYGKGSGDITLEDLVNYNQEHHILTDPRQGLASLRSLGILYFVMPDRVSELSTDSVDLSRVPSAGRSGKDSLWKAPNFAGVTGLQGLDEIFQDDQGFYQFSQDQITNNELYGIAYAFDSFQGIENPFYQEDTEYHALEYEVEYLLAGKDSDAENVQAVANRLFCLRLIPNLIYAFTDKEMKAQAEIVAAAICVPTDMEALIKPLTYVFLTCWGCAESIMDVKALFQGERVPLIKSDKTWQLSISNIGRLAEQEIPEKTGSNPDEGTGSNRSGHGDTHGLNYSEYMAVMLALMPDRNLKYYRMLDIIELNIQEAYPQFEIEHCIDEFRLQAQIRERGISWYIEGIGSYIR